MSSDVRGIVQNWSIDGKEEREVTGGNVVLLTLQRDLDVLLFFFTLVEGLIGRVLMHIGTQRREETFLSVVHVSMFVSVALTISEKFFVTMATRIKPQLE